MPPRIAGLLWTEEAERHVAEHIDPDEIDELIEGRDFFLFANRPGHPPNRWRAIGRIPGGAYVTAVLEEPDDGDPMNWRPVTGWRSDHFERRMYQAWRRGR